MVDWDGKEVSEVIEDPHRLKPLEEASEDEVTPTHISVVVIIVVVVVLACCCYCVWRNRTKIATEARRASTFLARKSESIRRSIRRTLGMKDE